MDSNGGTGALEAAAAPTEEASPAFPGGGVRIGGGGCSVKAVDSQLFTLKER